jgi:hypothetical protein
MTIPEAFNHAVETHSFRSHTGGHMVARFVGPFIAYRYVPKNGTMVSRITDIPQSIAVCPSSPRAQEAIEFLRSHNLAVQHAEAIGIRLPDLRQ